MPDPIPCLPTYPTPFLSLDLCQLHNFHGFKDTHRLPECLPTDKLIFTLPLAGLVIALSHPGRSTCSITMHTMHTTLCTMVDNKIRLYECQAMIGKRPVQVHSEAPRIISGQSLSLSLNSQGCTEIKWGHMTGGKKQIQFLYCFWAGL